MILNEKSQGLLDGFAKKFGVDIHGHQTMCPSPSPSITMDVACELDIMPYSDFQFGTDIHGLFPSKLIVII